jgi:tRNA/rRNA methyltransferase
VEQQFGENLNQPTIILVRPQLGENIGAAARIMLNFGLTELRIVAPRDGWPSQAAEAMAVGAIEVIKCAKIFATLEQSIEDIDMLYGTTARHRYMHKAWLECKELTMPPVNQKLAIMFGPERSGLSNEEVALADKILSIPVNPNFTSINLAQAVGIICYELTKISNKEKLKIDYQPVKQGDLNSFFTSLEQMLTERDFFKVADKKPGMMRNIKNIFKRITPLTKQDLSTLYGIIKTLNNR